MNSNPLAKGTSLLTHLVLGLDLIANLQVRRQVLLLTTGLRFKLAELGVKMGYIEFLGLLLSFIFFAFFKA